MMRIWVALGILMERMSWDSKLNPLSLNVCSVALLCLERNIDRFHDPTEKQDNHENKMSSEFSGTI